ncbi:hypothetical protein LJC41_01120 [Desulfosarcina sp. OttesenSCG-928-G17]|nr:hypothetical protein [Desulfosarcina sp. OttesenSCG-928-G17]
MNPQKAPVFPGKKDDLKTGHRKKSGAGKRQNGVGVLAKQEIYDAGKNTRVPVPWIKSFHKEKALPDASAAKLLDGFGVAFQMPG